MIIFFGFGGAIFIVIFFLLIVCGATEMMCESIFNFLDNNTIPIFIVFAILSLLAAIINGILWNKKSSIPPVFLIFFQLMLCLYQGLYFVVSNPYDSAFLVIWSFIIYVAVFLVDVAITYAIMGMSSEKKRLLPLYLAGIAGIIFNLGFW